MASAHFKAMIYAGALLLSLALMGEAAVAEMKQREQQFAQVRSRQWNDLTAD